MAVDKKIIIDFQFINDTSLDAIEKTKKAILDLKVEREKLRLQGKEESKQYALIDAQLANLTKTLKTQQKELQNNLRAMEAGDGSIKALREQLKSLLQTYDALSEDTRKSEFGQNMQKQIETITNDLKKLEEETGRAQRSVGDYEGSIRRALSDGLDTTPLKTQLRQLTSELQSLTLAQRQLGESMKTMTDPQEIAEAQAQYDKLGAAINDTAAKAGMLKDTVEDTGKVISAQADDYPAISALNEGITALVDSYTVLKGVTTALGIENDRLLDVMAKVQVLQQSVNALNRIAIALDKAKNGSLAIQQTSFWKLVQAKMADRKASLAQAKANATLATSEGAATLGANGLRKAMIALKASFMSIPGIGWIAAAAAAITALTVKIVKARKEAKAMAQDFDMQINGLSNVDKQAVVTKSNLLAMADAAMSAAQGSKEQEYWVRQVAQQTGVSYEYLKDHLDIMPQLIEKYAQLAYAQDLFKRSIEMSGEIADTSTKLQDFWTQIQSIDGSGKTYVENVKKAMESVTDETVKQSKTFKTLQKQVEYYKKDADGLRLTIRGSAEEFGSVARTAKSEIKDLQDEQDKILNEAKKNSEEAGTFMADIQKKASVSVNKSSKSAVDSNKVAAKAVETIWDKLYNQTLPQILKKYDKETEDILSQVPKHMKGFFEGQRYLERFSLIDKYVQNTRSVATKLVNDLKGAYQILGNMKGIRDLELGVEWDWERLELNSQDRNDLKTIVEEIQKIISSVPLEINIDEQSWEDIDWEEFLGNLETPEEFIETIEKLQGVLYNVTEQIGENTNISREQAKAYKLITDDAEMALDVMLKIKQTASDSIPIIKRLMGVMGDIYDEAAKNEDQISLALTKELTNIYKNLDDPKIDIKVRLLADKFNIKKAENELEAAKKEFNSIFNLSDEEKNQLGDAYADIIRKAEIKVANAELKLSQSVEDEHQHRLQLMKEETAEKIDAYMKLGQAAADAFGALAGLFDTLAEKDSRYAKYAKDMALMQITIASAVSLANAIVGATNAAKAGGPLAPILIAAYIAEMVGIVAGAISQAIQIYDQVSVPHYAHGGYIDKGTTSKADDVPAMVSRGEYIVQADAVKMYGKDYFDSLNAGLVRGDMDIAGALRSALADMPSPIVSVKEINNMQNRVRVKEDISRGKIN